jgi:lyso-ornithine lipid O-acyltransferase
LLLRVRWGSRLELWRQAHWLHLSCSRIARRLDLQLEARGLRPSEGLICSNHLSYLDILIYAAVTPCIFVSRSDVRHWPVFGFMAWSGGTIFLDRTSRASAGEVAPQIRAALEAGVPVLLFPEGTSTDGDEVRRFHPTLLAPAVESGSRMSAAAIGYHWQGGDERDLCWFGEAAFLPHLLRTLARASIVAEVEFFPDRNTYSDRKTAALELHEQVEAMRKRMKREALA